MNFTNLVQYKEEMMQKYKPKTVNSKIAACMGYCRFKGYDFRVKQLCIQRKTHLENVISEQQWERLITGLIRDNDVRGLVNLLVIARTGARISEAVRITKADIRRGFVEMKTKNKVRRIIIPDSLSRDLEKYLANLPDNAPVMRSINGNGREPMQARCYQYELKRYAERYGIPKECMHPHGFRHFFAVKFMKNNGNITLLAEILGHSNINTTMIYTQLSAEQQREEISRAVDW